MILLLYIVITKIIKITAYSRIEDSLMLYTVEPPNNGQLGTRHFVRCSEVGLSWRSTNIFN